MGTHITQLIGGTVRVCNTNASVSKQCPKIDAKVSLRAAHFSRFFCKKISIARKKLAQVSTCVGDFYFFGRAQNIGVFFACLVLTLLTQMTVEATVAFFFGPYQKQDGYRLKVDFNKATSAK